MRFLWGRLWLRWRPVRDRLRDKALSRRVLPPQGTHHPLQLRRGWSPLRRHPPEEGLPLRVRTDQVTVRAPMSELRLLLEGLLRTPASILLRFVGRGRVRRSPKRMFWPL